MQDIAMRSLWNISNFSLLASTFPSLYKLVMSNSPGRSSPIFTYSMMSFVNAATTIMNHSPEAWDYMPLKDVVGKVANVELYYKAVHFYLQEHPDLINDPLNVLALRVDHTSVVYIMQKVEKHELLEMR
ncbi:hypothetical protein H6P81_003100 [Aristolochia fimbriata]|uniref:Uncharacterized protein n=1 Tax=Aristolochia fimbriata TaxID=158543 RepID=A0AAV7FEW3_ARIFI|nr:hypothetical protein H6P81_003100 [Aristolochia fimbriata]